MPSYRVHLVASLIIYLGVIHCCSLVSFTASSLVQGLLFCLFGSLFPDVDIKSRGQQIFYLLLVVILAALLWFKQHCLFVVMSFVGIVPILVRHRGIFHHVWFLTIMTIFCSFLISVWCGVHQTIMTQNIWFFFIGSLSHVFLDRVVTLWKRQF